ncbi:MAG: acetyl-CoA decarbonylase/synthase complex subunit delta [Dehalococcoidia bacterium]|nr:MAG: acetyl-CoA decarbonylase/synthase complex subunit delta [Dehalococcoidia bacterium]
MALELPKQNYSGQIKTVTLGTGTKAAIVGGETCYPFFTFEGSMPNLPKIAMEVYDIQPDDWPPAALEPFSGVTHDPLAWAQKCVADYGAEMLCLQLASTDPNGANAGAEAAAATVKRVADGVNVPLIVWGTANHEKDTEVLKRVCEVCQDKKLIVGPVEEGDYKKIAAVALGYGHTIAASSPIDINLAKQLNILLGNLGVPDSQIVLDPTVSSIGYGIEYCYSVIERIRMAALTQQDEKLASPIIVNIARETWKSKEAKLPTEQDPKLGDVRGRGILLEAMSAWVLLLAGGDVAVMRHPEAIRLVKGMIAEISQA